jgi:hypothetical protein
VGAWARGLLFGLIVSPCVSPFAASVLVYIATTGNIALGGMDQRMKSQMTEQMNKQTNEQMDEEMDEEMNSSAHVY